MSTLAIVDHLVANLPVPTGMVRDGSGAQPSPFLADTLHAWPGPMRWSPEGTGGDRLDFEVGLAVCVAASEGPGEPRERSVSEQLDGAIVAIRAWVATHRGVAGLWEWLQVAEADPDSIRSDEHRGVRLTLSGWRLED